MAVALVDGRSLSVEAFEAAAWASMNPPPGVGGAGAPPPPPGSAAAAALASYLAAKALMEELADMADTPSVCVALFLATRQPRAKFCALQALESYVSGGRYAGTDEAQRVGMRSALLEWAASRGDALFDEPSYVRTRLAVVLGLVVKADFPAVWPGAFADIMAALSGAAAPLDLLLRLCAAIEQEVVEQHAARPAEEQAANTAVKDAMRDSGAVASLVEAWTSVAEGYVDSRPALAALALAVLAQYVSWIDAALVLNDRTRGLLHAYLLHPRVIIRAASARVLVELLRKGMDDVSRLAMVNMLGLDALLTAVAEPERAGLLVGSGGDDDGGVDTSVPGEADTAAAVEILMDNRTDFRTPFGDLVAAAGHALLVGGEALSPAAHPDACAWTVGALRAVIPLAARLVAEQGASLGVRLAPLLGDVAALFVRETRATAGASAGPITLPSSPALAGASGIGLAVPPLLYSSSGDGDPFSRVGGAAARRRAGAPAGSGSGPAGGGGTRSRAGSGSGRALGSAAAAVAGVAPWGGGGDGGGEDGSRFPGRPAGLSMTEFVPLLLDLLPARYTYPRDYEPPPPPDDDGDEEGDGDGELGEAAAVRELRDALRRTYVTLLRAAPDAVLAYLTGSVLTPERLEALQAAEWNVAEAVCGLLYWYGDAVSNTPAALRAGTSPLSPLLVTVFTRGIPAHHAPAVLTLLQYYELVGRYAPAVVACRPDILPSLFEDMVGSAALPTGLRHPKPQVRSRVANLLLRTVKTILREIPTVSLEAYTDPLLAGIADFLEIPFTMPGGRGAGGAGGGGGGGGRGAFMVEAGTHGSSGLGGTDQQYIFEMVGLLVSAPWMSLDRRISYASAAISPLVRQVEDGLAWVGGGAAGGGPLDVSSWTPDVMTSVGSWLWNVLNAIGYAIKGVGVAGDNEALGALMESALGAAERALAALPQHTEVRSRAVFLLHRCFESLGARALPRLHDLMPALMAAGTADDLAPTLTLLASLVARFKDAVAPFLAAHLAAVFERVFAVMPPPPPLRLPAAGATAGSLRAAVPIFEAPAAAGAGPHRFGGRPAAAGRAGGGLTAVHDEDTRARADLQKAFVALLQAVVVSGTAADVFLAPPTLELLPDVVRAVTGIMSTVTELTIARTILSIFTALVRQWLPVTPLPPLPSLNSLAAGSGAGGRGAPAPSSGVPAGAVAGAGAAAVALGTYASQGTPSPVAPGALPAVLGVAMDQLVKAPFAVAYAPYVVETDAQLLLVATDGAALLLSLVVHCAAHAPAGMDLPAVLAHVVNVEVGATGASGDACTALGSALFAALAAPPPDAFRDPELRAAVLGTIVELRRAALAALPS